MNPKNAISIFVAGAAVISVLYARAVGADVDSILFGMIAVIALVTVSYRKDTRWP